MTQFFEFIAKNAALASMLVFVLGFWAAYEIRHKKQGIKKLSLHAAVSLLNHQQGIVVDLRSLADFNKGHVDGALHFPFSQLSQKVSELHRIKDKPIILVCQNGFQAPGAFRILKKEGFDRLYYLEGGIAGWQSERMPLVKNG